MTSPFSLTSPKYDSKTFSGRLRTNFDIVDPRTLLVTNAEILKQVELLKKYKAAGATQGCLPGVTDADLWRARKIKESAVHPDTGEIIYRPFRMSGFVPYGTPIVLAMLLRATTNSIPLTIAAQTMNQSHNAAVNWCNRSATKSGDPSGDILRGYGSAVGVAVSISTASMLMLARLPPSPRTEFLRMFVPWPAVCCASTSNMVMMRLPELSRGITLKDAETGEEVGTSQVAAKMAIQSTAVARATLATAAVLGPQLCYAAAEKYGLYNKFPKSRTPTQAVFTLLCFGLGVPVSLSFFTQEMVVEASAVEKEFQ
eukprot:PhF_6_TR29128/c0_g1_i1/m.42526